MKKFLNIILILFLFLICSCKGSGSGGEVEKDPDEGKTVIQVEAIKDSIPEGIDTEDLDFSVIKILITYEDGTTREAGLTEQMLIDGGDTENLAALKEGASKRITASYKGCECKLNITTINYRALDPKLGDNDMIIMVRRTEDKSKVELAALSNVGFSSLQACFAYNDKEFNFNEKDIQVNEAYDIYYRIQDSKIYVFLFAKNIEIIKGDVTLLTIGYTESSDYRKANFEIDKSFKSSAIYFDNVSKDFKEFENIIYHYSKR